MEKEDISDKITEEDKKICKRYSKSFLSKVECNELAFEERLTDFYFIDLDFYKEEIKKVKEGAKAKAKEILLKLEEFRKQYFDEGEEHSCTPIHHSDLKALIKELEQKQEADVKNG